MNECICCKYSTKGTVEHENMQSKGTLKQAKERITGSLKAKKIQQKP